MAEPHGRKGQRGDASNNVSTGRDGANAAGPVGVTKPSTARRPRPPPAMRRPIRNTAPPVNNIRNRALTANVQAHPGLFDLPDPELVLRRARAARAPRAPRAPRVPRAPRAPRKPTKKGKKSASAARPASAAQASQSAPAANPAPVAQASSPPHPLPGNDGHEAGADPAAIEPTLENEPTAEDLAANQEAEREAAEAEQAVRDAAAAKDRAEKEEAAKKAEAKRKQEAEREKAERERTVREKLEREKAAREQAESERAAREKAEREKAEREEAEREKAEREKAAREHAEREKAAREKAEREKEERERAEREKEEKEAREREEKEAREKEEEKAREMAKREAREKEEKEAREKEEREAQERKEEEAREKAREKLVLDEAARENAIRAEKARLILAEETAAKEKEAQEKAAQEEEAKTKAAQEEAAKAKANTKTDERFAHEHASYLKMQEQEAAAKMEAQRLAKEKAKKEEEELARKEAAGFKRAGKKRAAPVSEDDSGDTNKKAKVECKESCKRLDYALEFAKFTFKQKATLPSFETHEDPVQFGSHLSLDTISQALASVTEAINTTLADQEQQKLFSLFHPRSMIDPVDLEHPVILQRHNALVPIDRSAGSRTHFSLISLVQKSGRKADGTGRNFFEMHHYDSDPALRAAFHSTIRKITTRGTILKTGWAGPNKSERESTLGESQNMVACDRPVGKEWTSGLHVVLNGWVCALALRHNINALLSKPGFYEKAVDIVNLAMRGCVSSQMILDFFDCYEYTEPDELLESDRNRRTFKETKDFEIFATLDTHIMKLLDRNPRRDMEALMKKPEPPKRDAPLSSGLLTSKSGTFPLATATHLQGVEGPAGLPKPKEEPVVEEPQEELVVDAGYDSARSDSDEFDEGDIVLEMEAPKRKFDPFTGREITAASIAAKEKLLKDQQERERQAAARQDSIELDNPDMDSLFDENADFDELFGDDGLYDQPPAPTSAPQGDNTQEDADEEDLYSASPPRGSQSQPHLQSTVVDDEEEEDLYSASPPRRPDPPPTASTLNFPGPPPPTPHDPSTNNNPFTLIGLKLPQPQAHQLPGISISLQQNPSPPVLAPAPPRQSNAGFRVPSTPSASTNSDSSLVKPAVPRPIVVPNPNGSFRVPTVSSPSDNDGEQPSGKQSTGNPAAGTWGRANRTHTNQKAAEPTDEDLEAAWQEGFGGKEQDPDLETAMAEYDEPEPPLYQDDELISGGMYELEPEFEDLEEEQFEEEIDEEIRDYGNDEDDGENYEEDEEDDNGDDGGDDGEDAEQMYE